MSIKDLNKPTPSKWKKIGNVLLLVSGMLSAISLSLKHEYISIALVVCGAIGKFLTELTTDEIK